MNYRIGLAGLLAAAVIASTRRRGEIINPGSVTPASGPAPLPQPVYVPASTTTPPIANAPNPTRSPAAQAAVVGRVIAAAATNNPKAMRAEAAKLRAEGWPDQAGDLEELARRIDEQRATGGPVITDPMSGQVIPNTQWPVAPAPAPPKPPPPAPTVAAPPKPPTPPVAAPPKPPTPAAPAMPANMPVLSQAPPKPPAPAPAPAVSGNLKQGDKGAAVKAWQLELRNDGFSNVVADSDFGPTTTAATIDLELDRGLPATGIVTPSLRNLVPFPPILGRRVLRQGSRGGAVKSWQRALIASGQTQVVVDGAFEGETVTATKFWQTQRKLTADGVVGEKTVVAMGIPLTVVAAVPIATAAVQAAVQAIYPTTFDPAKWRAVMKRGDSGADVAEWQTILSRDGYVSLPDGKFGAETEAATRKWQAARKLTADGIVGPGTRAAIAKTAAPAARVSGYELPEQVPWRDLTAVSPMPGMLAEVPTEVVAPERALANRLALHLFFALPGSEDRSLVQLFQITNGLNTTGSYGRETAECLIAYGIVPPKPRAWPSKGGTVARARYRAALQAQARRDPTRALEWRSAAEAVQR